MGLHQVECSLSACNAAACLSRSENINNLVALAEIVYLSISFFRDMTHGVPDLALNNLIGEFPLQEANFLSKRQMSFPKGKRHMLTVGKHSRQTS